MCTIVAVVMFLKRNHFKYIHWNIYRGNDMSKICFKIIRGRNMLREQRWNATNIGLINYWSWGMSTQGLITWLLTFWELKFFHKKFLENRAKRRTSLVVQWLRLCTATAEGAGSIPAQGTKSLYVTWLWPKKKKSRRRWKIGQKAEDWSRKINIQRARLPIRETKKMKGDL